MSEKLKTLEAQYPKTFDDLIKEIMATEARLRDLRAMRDMLYNNTEFGLISEITRTPASTPKHFHVSIVYRGMALTVNTADLGKEGENVIPFKENVDTGGQFRVVWPKSKD